MNLAPLGRRGLRGQKDRGHKPGFRYGKYAVATHGEAMPFIYGMCKDKISIDAAKLLRRSGYFHIAPNIGCNLCKKQQKMASRKAVEPTLEACTSTGSA